MACPECGLELYWNYFEVEKGLEILDTGDKLTSVCNSLGIIDIEGHVQQSPDKVS